MTATVDPDRSEWDVIVLGGAAAGENAALYATQFSGLTAVIVEKDLVGGECSYWACMPSKALLRPVEVLAAGRDLPGVREAIGDRALDTAAVLARRDTVVKHLDDSSQVRWALDAGIDVVRGHGRLDGERTVVVAGPDGRDRRLTARHAVVLDTGSSPFVPAVPGLREARPWTSRDVTNLHEVPARVVILGAGVVACEAATWLRGLGVAQVTIVHRGSRLLERNEPFAGELVAAGFRESGIVLRLRTTATSVRRADVTDAGAGRLHGGELTVSLSDGDTVTADEVVVATGRTPNNEGIGLETVGLDPGKPLVVDDHMTVLGAGGDWLYAIGDLCGRAQLTHMAKYQARVAGRVIAARAAGRPLGSGSYSRYADLADHGLVPQVIFTDPEIGAVGLTEAEARARHLDVEVVEYDLAQLAGTYVLRDNYVGRAKLVLDRSADVVVGATFAGAGVAELTHSATMAVVARIPVPVLWHVVPSYPTVSEVWLRLLETHSAAREARS
ncbi:dihydrolipoyl dehydrogenase family protein [Couchioplanes azureus]|uniref:dihydrolipoyl dehydrogenase family protein n=1 Tax=Couchioplanes caeruleus TaxID=56438 RepID=UPI001670FF9B|nr:NAD(P)/FAD-dependent oxidoreductase [Couchioplanes caeruleus]GGQ74972.1 oxidoreductase [Couchioplanes caeruleus subsp. azureus]